MARHRKYKNSTVYFVSNSNLKEPTAYAEYTLQDINKIKNSLKGGMDYDEDLLTIPNTVDAKTGAFTAGFIANGTAQDRNFGKILDSLSGDFVAKRGYRPKITKKVVPNRRGYLTLNGEENIEKAIENVKAHGGEIWHHPTKDNPDRYDYFYPDLTDNKDDRAKVHNEIFGEPRAKSKKLREETKQKEIDKEKKEDKKEKEKSKREVASAIVKAVAVLTLIFDMTRRILSSIIDSSARLINETKEAGNLGVTRGDIVNYGIQEASLGMKENTIKGSLTDLQSMFGNLNNLDESALEKLALVMGSDIKDMIKLGMGESDLYKLMLKIVDTYTASAMKGINSLGMNVGTDKARQELYTQLNSISGNLADIFSTLMDNLTNSDSIYYGRFKTAEELFDISTSRDYNVDGIDAGVAFASAQLIDRLEGIVKEIKENLMIKVEKGLLDALTKMANSTFWMTDLEKLEFYKSNKEKNKKSKEMLEGTIDSVVDSEASVSLNKYKNASPNAFKKAGLYDKSFSEIYYLAASGNKDAKSVIRSLIVGSRDNKIVNLVRFLMGIEKAKEMIDEQNKKEDTNEVPINTSIVKDLGWKEFKNRAIGLFGLNPSEPISIADKQVYKNVVDTYFEDDAYHDELSRVPYDEEEETTVSGYTVKGKWMNKPFPFIDKLNSILNSVEEKTRKSFGNDATIDLKPIGNAGMTGKIIIDINGAEENNAKIRTTGDIINLGGGHLEYLEYAHS